MDQEVLIWGTGEFGQIQMPMKLGLENVRFKEVSLSKGRDSFGAGIDIDGFLYSWGDNTSG